jgi:hypothetical protein
VDTATQLAPQNNQLMSKHRVLSLKPHLRLEWRGQDGQDETQKPDHSASLGDSVTSSTRIEFSVHTGLHIAGKLCKDLIADLDKFDSKDSAQRRRPVWPSMSRALTFAEYALAVC